MGLKFRNAGPIYYFIYSALTDCIDDCFKNGRKKKYGYYEKKEKLEKREQEFKLNMYNYDDITREKYNEELKDLRNDVESIEHMVYKSSFIQKLLIFISSLISMAISIAILLGIVEIIGYFFTGRFFSIF